MKSLKLVLAAALLVGAVSCTGGSDKKEPAGPTYDFKTCVDKFMEMAGPGADDGDRHSAEMACQPCSMPGGQMACKKIIESFGP